MLNDGNAFVVANALAALTAVLISINYFCFKVVFDFRYRNQKELIC